MLQSEAGRTRPWLSQVEWLTIHDCSASLRCSALWAPSFLLVFRESGRGVN